MTRAEMRAFLRRRIDDTHTSRWSDSDLNDELLSSARFHSQKAEMESVWPRILKATQTLTVVSGTTEYALNANFVLLHNARRTDVTPVVPCTEISEEEWPEWETQKTTFDALGRPVFYLSRNTTPIHTFNFPYDPLRAMTIVLDYQKIIADVSGDSASYDIPTPLHEVVYLYAGINLLGVDAATQAGVVTDYDMRMQQFTSLLRQTRRANSVVVADGIT